ncbi:coagulation factor X-like [Coregonus clupeaformis]|uniref:coagulation factor X-like n=1 Tax=Coregonus clupeaformis TaxID=59861 RepID=UPI001E1C847B|nr:coagulation factor X-like [Coregonus clupeaformis]
MGKKLHSMHTGASNNSVRIPLSTQLYIHNRHKRGSLEDDLALVRLNEPFPFGPSVSHLCLPTKDFCENVLMSPGREGVARGPDKLRGESHGHPVLSYLHVEGCQNQVNFSQLLSNKMFCMGRQKCFCRTELTRFNETDLKPGLTRNRSLLSGTPVVTVERHTAFLTGLLLSPPTSHDCGQTLVFTKLSRYLHWIQQHLDMTEVRMTPQITQDPPGPYGVTPT